MIRRAFLGGVGVVHPPAKALDIVDELLEIVIESLERRFFDLRARSRSASPSGKASNASRRRSMNLVVRS